MNIPDDLVRRLQNGDMEALKVIFERASENIYRVSLGILGNRNDAEDALQDIFVRLPEFSKKFGFRAAFSSWLYRLTVNHCLNKLKRRRLLDWLPLFSVAEPSSRRDTDEIEAKDAVNSLLLRIDPKSRSLLTLRELEGLSYSEIADALSMPVGSVRSGINRARRKMKELLSKDKRRH